MKTMVAILALLIMPSLASADIANWRAMGKQDKGVRQLIAQKLNKKENGYKWQNVKGTINQHARWNGNQGAVTNSSVRFEAQPLVKIQGQGQLLGGCRGQCSFLAVNGGKPSMVAKSWRITAKLRSGPPR